ncbi:MAG: hypothetical protein ACR2PW_04935 [Gammaproteobacteria bacterium]
MHDSQQQRVTTNLGRISGHWIRRGIHLSMPIIPWAYYWHGPTLSELLNTAVPLAWSLNQWLAAFVILLLALEALRLHLGWKLPGYRSYEQKQISAMAWGTLAIGLTLLLVPDAGYMNAAYGLPLVASLSLADPLMGELRARSQLQTRWITAIGWATVTAIWLVSTCLLGGSWWLVAILPPICIWAEQIDLGWMDDNASMILAPLIIILLLSPWLTP